MENPEGSSSQQRQQQPAQPAVPQNAPPKPADPEANDVSTLYVGNLHPCVTVTALQEICTYFGPVEQVKVIKDKNSGQSAGYGFVKFMDRRCANLALQYLQGKVFYGQELRVNWAFQSHQREDTSNHFHVFVGDLGQEVTDAVLYSSFSALPGCSDARVMWDHATGRSKGYGFVSLRSREEAQHAIERMHGQVIGSRRVRCGWAQHKQEELPTPLDFATVDQSDPHNTNVYVGNIAPEWSGPDIQAHFAHFGRIFEVKLHKKGGYGFIRYERHEDAVNAIVSTHGTAFHGRGVKCSWGKNSTNSAANQQQQVQVQVQQQAQQAQQQAAAAALYGSLVPTGLQAVPGMMAGGQALMPGLPGTMVTPSMVMPGALQPGAAGLLQAQYLNHNQVMAGQAMQAQQPMLILGGQPGTSLSAVQSGGRVQQGAFGQEPVFYSNGVFYQP